MHATYCFLFSRNDFGADISLDVLGKSVVDRFESGFATDRCDENNWYQPMVLVTDKGDLVQLSDKGDYRGRDSFIKQFSSTKKSHIILEALRFAIQCIATDMELYDASTINLGNNDGNRKIDNASRQEIIADVKRLIPERLAQSYMDAINSDLVGNKFDMDAYKRQRQARQYEIFIRTRVFGFSTEPGITPYDFRCFDLRENNDVPEDGDKLMVLFVDIHT